MVLKNDRKIYLVMKEYIYDRLFDAELLSSNYPLEHRALSHSLPTFRKPDGDQRSRRSLRDAI